VCLCDQWCSEIQDSKYAGPISFRPVSEKEPYIAPDFAEILNTPDYKGPRRRGGKKVRVKQMQARRYERMKEKGRVGSAMKQIKARLHELDSETQQKLDDGRGIKRAKL